MNLFRYIFLTMCVMFFASCASVFWQPMQHKEARIGEATPGGSVLDSLPEPKEPLIVAVYQFRDQTGQYKPAEGGSSFSTAVTQGAATVLVKVLEDSKWFQPIERENIGNLLNERKIVRSTRQQYGLNDELPALLYAGVMLEGGIISYDANVITGGAGLRYFGSGASSQYRQDRVTVYLRAISTSNGKILKTVYASKTILSQAMDGGLFRYVAFRRLLEAETGFTYNEPSEVAITEAIEKAVYSLIVEGIEANLWELKDGGKKKTLLDTYKTENTENDKTDVLGRMVEPRRRSVQLGIGMHNLWYKGDFARGRLTPGISAALHYNFRPRASLGAKVYTGSFRTAGNYQSGVTGADLLFSYRYTPWYKATPYLQAGLGALRTDQSGSMQPLAVGGLGIEYLAKPWLGLHLFSDCHYGFTDKWDGVNRGVSPDFAYSVQAGLHFYFGRAIKSDPVSKSVSGKPTKKGPLQDF
jgi:curli production assembly/transport component CsgG